MQHDSVLDMVNNVGEDKELLAALTKKFNSRQIVKKLVAFRAVKGYSQTEMAKKLHWNTNDVICLEEGTDNKICLGELRQYAGALGFNLEIVLTPKET